MALSAAAAAQSGIAGAASAQASVAPFPVTDLNHCSFAVKNTTVAREFYERIFDLTVFTHQMSGTWPILSVGRGPQFLCPIDTGIKLRHHFSFHMPKFDPEAAVQHSKAMGFEARFNRRKAEEQRPYGTDDCLEFHFSGDPDGLGVQIQDETYCGGSGRLGEVCNITPQSQRHQAPLRVRSINSVQLRCANVDKALAFYQKIVAVKVITRQEKGAVPVMTIANGPQYVSLHEGPVDSHHFSLGIDNFEPAAVMKILKDNHVDAELRMRLAADQRPVVSGAKDTPEITIRDPDGNTIKIVDYRNGGGVGPLGNIFA